LDDYGFVFERSEAGTLEADIAENNTIKSRQMDKDNGRVKTEGLSSKSEASKSLNFHKHWGNSCQSAGSGTDETPEWSRESRNQSEAARGENHNETGAAKSDPPTSLKYILYIQMQFCSQKTLADFLSNEEARKGPSVSTTGVDIPFALSLFLQIMQGVKHVHSQGLIHRDLKPNNCFIDDSGVVKVGDFGLSRESSDTSNRGDVEPVLKSSAKFDNGDITAGVGTRAYASPEQMKGGSDYDSSTDIYSLGIILFELCYPMYTVSQVLMT
jgi:serine/threonine protein kinase